MIHSNMDHNQPVGPLGSKLPLDEQEVIMDQVQNAQLNTTEVSLSGGRDHYYYLLTNKMHIIGYLNKCFGVFSWKTFQKLGKL